MGMSSTLRWAALGAAFLTIMALPAAAIAATPEQVATSVGAATQWLRAQQGPNPFEPAEPYTGQIPGFGGDWSATALAAATVDTADVRNLALGPPSFQDHLLGEYTSGEWLDLPGTGEFPLPATDYERAVLVSNAAGLDPARLSAASNMPSQIAGLWNASTGSFGSPSTNATAFGILALVKTPLPGWALEPAVSYLRRNQHDDGGWNYGAATTPTAKETSSDPDMTGAAIAAFCEAGVPAYDSDVAEGVEFIHDKLEESGAIEAPFGSNLDTNAWVISGLNACGIDPQSAEWTTAAGKTPVDYVLSLQVATAGPDAGGFGYSSPEFPGVYSTQDALRAIAGAVFTAEPPSLRTVPSVAAGTPVPHVLAIEFAPGNVRMCKVTAPAGAPLTEVLGAAKSSSYPPGCIKSLAVSEGRVEAVDGVIPFGVDESWLARLDRGAISVAGQQLVGFGDLISLRRGATPASAQVIVGPAGAPGPTGQGGKSGKKGKRGPLGKPGHNATIVCKVRQRRRSGKQRVRCAVKHKGAHREATRGPKRSFHQPVHSARVR
jgi:hypothetical protein